MASPPRSRTDSVSHQRDCRAYSSTPHDGNVPMIDMAGPGGDHSRETFRRNRKITSTEPDGQQKLHVVHRFPNRSVRSYRMSRLTAEDLREARSSCLIPSTPAVLVPGCAAPPVLHERSTIEPVDFIVLDAVDHAAGSLTHRRAAAVSDDRGSYCAAVVMSGGLHHRPGSAPKACRSGC